LKLLPEFFLTKEEKKLKLNLDLRPQNLSPETYYELAKEYENLRN